MDSPYKLAGDILSATPKNSFNSVELYGSSVKKTEEDLACSVFHLENESGTGDITLIQISLCPPFTRNMECPPQRTKRMSDWIESGPSGHCV